MKLNPDIFKSYDIRGIYPSELNEEAVYVAARAFVKYTGAKKIVVGRDARVSSLALFNALAQGIQAEGAEVWDIGQGPTELLYFAVGAYDFDGGIMITASHNPKEYNGLKMLQKKNGAIQMVRGKELLEVVERSSFEKDDSLEKEIFKKDAWQDYLIHILSFVDLSEILPMKIAVDASNGVGGLAVSKIQDKLPVEIIPLNFVPDGNFPNHSPNPLMLNASDEIGILIQEKKTDFGIMFDGDADRVFLVDEQGKLVAADVTLLLLAKYFLAKNPGMAISYNLICSKAVPEFVKKWGGVPIKTQVGFVNVREGLLKNNGIMGGELSGHYCFKDNFYMDSGMIAFLVLLQIISKDGRKVSEIVKELSPYVKTDVNVTVNNKDAVLEKIKKRYADGAQDFLDGVTVSYKDWWFNLRPSNTEPILRLTIEADTEEVLSAKKEELEKLIAE